MIKREGLAKWRQAFLLALGFHIALFLLFFFYPSIWHKKIRIPASYNVQLFEPSALSPSESPRAEAKSKVVPKVSRPVVAKKQSRPQPKKAVPKKKATQKKAKSKTPVAKRSTKKAISLRPKKVQKKRAKKGPKKKKIKRAANKPTQKQRAVNEEKRLSQRLKKIQERVREKEEEKILQERLARIKKKVQAGSSSSRASSTPRGVKGAGVDDALRRYAGAIWMHVRKNWHFPEELLKRKDIEAIVSIRVDKSGHILSKRFEQRSGFAAFDRSVMKAVQDSDPLPPLPAQLGPGPIEIGIRFNPSRMSSQDALQGA